MDDGSNTLSPVHPSLPSHSQVCADLTLLRTHKAQAQQAFKDPWTPLAPAPLPRKWHGTVYDASRRLAYVFGGENDEVAQDGGKDAAKVLGLEVRREEG